MACHGIRSGVSYLPLAPLLREITVAIHVARASVSVQQALGPFLYMPGPAVQLRVWHAQLKLPWHWFR